jgi:hypothetical protein
VVLDLPILYVLLRVLRRFFGTGGLYKSDIDSLFDISLNIFSLPRFILGEGVIEGGAGASCVVGKGCTIGCVAVGNGCVTIGNGCVIGTGGLKTGVVLKGCGSLSYCLRVYCLYNGNLPPFKQPYLGCGKKNGVLDTSGNASSGGDGNNDIGFSIEGIDRSVLL